ncbi:MAG TPA: V-type ATPase 116kDa subunit family protein, partial [Actinophytocola sp.]|uniref:V-type ATPase 116kDa subunit family protein n=1 Tax=Actinophytocola sp. TaxID=1872138 RepID=UPI002F922385
GTPPGDAARRLQHLPAPAATILSVSEPDLDALAQAGRADLLAGEAELEHYAAGAVRRGSITALTGWSPAPAVTALAARLARLGSAVAVLRRPRGVDPPTLLRSGSAVRRSFTPLVETYGSVPYRDLDPTVLAAIAYVVMFGMMFGDLGHGLLLVAGAAFLRAGRPRRFAGARKAAPLVFGAGVAASGFGVLYGEFFGPTGLLPPLWLEPLAEPMRLFAAAIGLGAVLLAVAYATGIVNRWREGGPRLALYAPSGIAGAALFLGVGGVVGGLYLDVDLLAWSGVAVATAGLVLTGVGLFAGSGGGAAGVLQTVVELFDVVVRLGANVISFARLAAFGMTHAALGWLVWQATTALVAGGPLGVLFGVLTFLAGNAVAFALEALVAGIQALRLEFYELFSRVFEIEGRPFQPWHVPMEVS